MKKTVCDTCGRDFTPDDMTKTYYLLDGDNRVVFEITAWPQYGYTGDMCNVCALSSLSRARVVDGEEMERVREKWKAEMDRKLTAGVDPLPVKGV